MENPGRSSMGCHYRQKMLVENLIPRPLDVWKNHVLEPFKVENKLAAYVAGLSRKDWRSLRKTIRSECSVVRDQEKPRLGSYFHGHFLFLFKRPL